MQELIKIEKRVIGAEETNAVSARELHETLEIKKDFTDWIKTQANRAGLRENVDYIIVSQKVEAGKGVSARKEYIITTDASKHIAMMSQGTKAKEVRDYFIAVEKEFKLQNSDELSSLAPMFREFIASQLKQNEMMMQMMNMILENQKKQIVVQHLNSEQLGKIRGAVNEACIPIMEYCNEEDENLTRKTLYSKLNNQLGTPSYIYIPTGAFEEAMTLLNNVRDKYYTKLENRKVMQLEINKPDEETKF